MEVRKECMEVQEETALYEDVRYIRASNILLIGQLLPAPYHCTQFQWKIVEKKKIPLIYYFFVLRIFLSRMSF